VTFLIDRMIGAVCTVRSMPNTSGTNGLDKCNLCFITATCVYTCLIERTSC